MFVGWSLTTQRKQWERNVVLGSRHVFVGGTNCELPYKRLPWRLGKKGRFGIFILTPLWMRCTGEIFSSENEIPTVEPLGVRG